MELVTDKIKYIEGIEIKEIEYSDEKITEDIIETEIMKIVGEKENEIKLINAFLYKRKQFEYEEEVRILKYNPDFLNDPKPSFPPEGLVALYNDGQISYNDCMRTIKPD